MWNIWYVAIAATLIIFVGIIWNKIDWSSVIPSALIPIGVFSLMICAIIIVASPISAKQEIRQFEYTKQMVYDSVNSGTESQNYAVTSSVIEMNEWLMATKAQRDTLGNWSIYSTGKIGESFDALTPITIKNID